MASSFITTSSWTTTMIFSGCTTSSPSSSSISCLLPFTTASKCRAFHLHSGFNPFLNAHIVPSAMATEACAKVIDGKKVVKEIREEVAVEVSRMKEVIGVPGLAVILVGDRKDSATYVRNKKKACENVGIKSFEVHLPEDSTEEEVLKHISGFNNDPAVHGILVQLPLPSHLNEQNVLNAVCIGKDVDGFHPLNIGRLAM